MFSEKLVKTIDEFYFGDRSKDELDKYLWGYQEEIIRDFKIKRKLISAKNGKSVIELEAEFQQELTSYVDDRIRLSLIAMVYYIKYGND